MIAYSLDLRKRVVEFVQKGGSKAEASRRFGVSQWCVFNWLKRKDLEPRKAPEGHNRRLDWEGLKKHVEEFPDLTLRERAKLFNSSSSQIGYALQKMRVTVKKTLKYQERSPERRADYLNDFQKIIETKQPKAIVYVDESGFKADTFRSRGWSKRGQKIHGERKGKREARINLIAAKWGKRIVAPLVFYGAANSDFFKTWPQTRSFQKIPKNSLIIRVVFS